MVSLCLVPHIITGKAKHGWNPVSKLMGTVSCLCLDAIYIVPMIWW